MLIDSALKATGGSIANKDAFRNALRAANFPSTRGRSSSTRTTSRSRTTTWTQIGKDEKGRLVNQMRGIIFSGHADAYASQCKMK